MGTRALCWGLPRWRGDCAASAAGCLLTTGCMSDVLSRVIFHVRRDEDFRFMTMSVVPADTDECMRGPSLKHMHVHIVNYIKHSAFPAPELEHS